MGNYALHFALAALQNLSGNAGRARIFDHAFIMAADVDDDAFEPNGELFLLPPIAKQVHVYHSERDDVLAISENTKHAAVAWANLVLAI